MKFSEYQAATGATAIYPDAGEGTWDAISYVGLGLGEVGEVQGKLKKIIRDHGGDCPPDLERAIKKELGDALWYVARLCVELDLDMDEIALANLEKLDDRKDRGVLGGSGDNR